MNSSVENVRPPWVARLMLLAGIWGTSFLFIKTSGEGLAPMQVTLGRVGLGAVTLVIFVALRRDAIPRDPRVWGHLAVVGVLANVIPFSLLAWGEERIASAYAAVWNGTTPLFTLLFALLLLPNERPDRRKVIGLALGFAGVVVVLGPWQAVGGATLTGQLACVGAAVAYGISIVYTRRRLTGSGNSPLVLAAGQLVLASIESAIVVALFARTAPAFDAEVVGSILALGVAGTGVAYVIYYGLIRDVGATTTSTVTYIVPVVASVLGITLLDETITWNVFAGAAVVVAGVVYAEGRLRARSVPSEAPSGN